MWTSKSIIEQPDTRWTHTKNNSHSYHDPQRCLCRRPSDPGKQERCYDGGLEDEVRLNGNTSRDFAYLAYCSDDNSIRVSTARASAYVPNSHTDSGEERTKGKKKDGKKRWMDGLNTPSSVPVNRTTRLAT